MVASMVDNFFIFQKFGDTKMKYIFYFSIVIILIGCHELPEPKLIHYYILNDSSNDSSFNYYNKSLDVKINIKGDGFVFTKGEWGVLFSKIVVNINNHGENNLQVYFENIELQSNYYKYSLVDTLQKLEFNTTEAKELKLLFRSSDKEDIKEVPMDDILILKLKLFIDGNNLDFPEVIFSPRKKS
jgi:hypothetical protein